MPYGHPHARHLLKQKLHPNASHRTLTRQRRYSIHPFQLWRTLEQRRQNATHDHRKRNRRRHRHVALRHIPPLRHTHRHVRSLARRRRSINDRRAHHRYAHNYETPLRISPHRPSHRTENACQNGKLFDARFDPVNPPEYVKCFGLMKLGREYLLTTQQLDIYGTAQSYQGPVLILHGKKDRLVPLWCSQQYLTTYPTTTSQLTIVEGENHRISRRTRQVATLITQFFKQH